jgi:pyrroline-5-carboxylate reductase
MMKFTIIGAGTMGAAIASCLSASGLADVVVANRSAAKLEALHKENPQISVTTDNVAAVAGADVVILAVKPWVLRDVIDQIKGALDYERQAVVSIAGGVGLDALDAMLVKDGALPAVFHIIPDTAITVGAGMTFISMRRAPESVSRAIADAFGDMGEAAFVEENMMDAATALSSCGIAYVYKYVQACIQAGVQMGFKPDDARRYVLATVKGAAEMMHVNNTMPQQEIDRVTTPGGMTIKGINELEHAGFVSAVIRAILKPLER